MAHYTVKTHTLHLNGSKIPMTPSPNQGGALKPLYLIYHYTAGTSNEGAVKWFQHKDAKASAHIVLARDGLITPMIPLNKVAWHAGRSSWNDLVGMNQYSIGIEIVNAGKLKKNEAGEWVSWSGVLIPNNEVLVLQHKHELSPAGWHAFTPQQIEAAVQLGLALHDAYEFVDILGHEDVAPGRKIDPGPAFPLPSIASKVLGRS